MACLCCRCSSSSWSPSLTAPSSFPPLIPDHVCLYCHPYRLYGSVGLEGPVCRPAGAVHDHPPPPVGQGRGRPWHAPLHDPPRVGRQNHCRPQWKDLPRRVRRRGHDWPPAGGVCADAPADHPQGRPRTAQRGGRGRSSGAAAKGRSLSCGGGGGEAVGLLPACVHGGAGGGGGGGVSNEPCCAGVGQRALGVGGGGSSDGQQWGAVLTDGGGGGWRPRSVDGSGPAAAAGRRRLGGGGGVTAAGRRRLSGGGGTAVFDQNCSLRPPPLLRVKQHLPPWLAATSVGRYVLRAHLTTAVRRGRSSILPRQ